MQNRTAYHKQNCLWPVRCKSQGWLTGSLLDRYAAGLLHFVRTPKGSLYWSTDYGSLFYKIRTQSLSIEEIEAYKIDTMQGLSRYVPDIAIYSMDAVIVPDKQRLDINIFYGVRGATSLRNGDLGRGQRLQVQV